jgi:hypothetical protein
MAHFDFSRRYRRLRRELSRTMNAVNISGKISVISGKKTTSDRTKIEVEPLPMSAK